MPTVPPNNTPNSAPKDGQIYENPAAYVGNRSDEKTGGAIRNVSLYKGTLEITVTSRRPELGLGRGEGDKSISQIAQEALKKEGVKFSMHPNPVPSFLPIIRIDPNQDRALDVRAIGTAILEGMVEYLKGKKADPKGGAKDHPARYEAELEGLQSHEGIRKFLSQPEVQGKISKATKDALEDKKGPEEAKEEEKPKVADERLAKTALNKATRLDFKFGAHEFHGRGETAGYSVVLQNEKDAHRLKSELTFGPFKVLKPEDVQVGFAQTTESGTMKHKSGFKVSIRADAMTVDVTEAISRLPRNPATLTPPPTVRGL